MTAHAELPAPLLAGALRRAARLASPRAADSRYAQIHVEVGPDGVRLASSDGTTYLEQHLPAETQGEGRLLLPGHLMASLARLLPDAPLRLRLEPKGARIEVGGFVADLLGAPAEGYPAPPEEAGAALELPAADLAQLLQSVRYAAASVEYRGVFRGVRLEPRGAELRAVATDGFRLALAALTPPQPCAASPALLPLPAAALLEDLAQAAGGTEAAARLEFAPGVLRCHLPQARLVARLIQGDYPDYEVLMRAKREVPVLEGSAELLRGALARLWPLADPKRPGVRLVGGTDGLELHVDGSEGEGYDALPLEVRSPDALPLTLNIAFLREALEPLEAFRLVWGEWEQGVFVRLEPREPQRVQRLAFLTPMR